jgi:TonB-linked SusC/RagA family outer membrane protein
MRFIYLSIIFSLTIFKVDAQFVVKGSVFSATGQPLPGTSVKNKVSGPASISAASGEFSIQIPGAEGTIVLSYVGYIPQEINVKAANNTFLKVTLLPKEDALEEVIVSTGYQTLPRERSTGSFVLVNQELIERKVSPDILGRLEDVVPGLAFNRIGAVTNPISVRGQSTINANKNPLIVLDNFPYSGDLNDINPNDVESITVLKDAAAASIWGARAGNGVIVITSKKGMYGGDLKISANANLTAFQKPDLFYQSRMSATDYIDTEQRLFNEGFYKASETAATKVPLSPLVEMLVSLREGRVSEQEVLAQINSWKSYDLRREYEKYLYQHALNQQYALSLSGGGQKHKYYLSTGYDHGRAALVANSNQRISINAGQTFSFFDQKLQVNTMLRHFRSNTVRNNPGASLTFNSQPLYPYAQLADDQGHSLSIGRYRDSFVQTALGQGLLDWSYRPMDEIMLGDNTSSNNHSRLNADVKYQLIPELSVQVFYQFSDAVNTSRNLQNEQSYYTRDQINRLTLVNADGSLTRPIPLGGILDTDESRLSGHSLRSQLGFNKLWGDKHRLDAIAGYEISQDLSFGRSTRLYGYDQEHAVSKTVNYTGAFKSYINPASVNNVIPNQDGTSEGTDRFISYYANSAYTYSGKYTASLSGRVDKSNLFGVNTNQKGVPLWSAGLAWNLSEEGFYPFSTALPLLKLRATYGYNGNIDKSLSAFTTASYNNGTGNLNNSGTRLPYAIIQNPPNPELRWERVIVSNFGMDFRTKAGRFSGSLEYYQKKGIELIGETPYPPSNGITSFTGNTANTLGKGIDLSLNTVNLKGKISWQTNFILSYIKEKVTAYHVKSSVANYLSFGLNGNYPLPGRPLYAIYSYPWAGLDPQTGDPQGYLNGEVSKDYAKIRAAVTADNIQYNGSARPELFGALRNTLSMWRLSLSANISYRLQYYFRRNSITYGSNYGLGGHSDYTLRWQKAGDEAFTQVPSIPAALNSNRDVFYSNAEVLVDKGDHIRFQDVNFSFDLSGLKLGKSSFKRAQIYLYANNIGMIWKASKNGVDPDYATNRPMRTLAAGFKFDF